MFSMTRALNGGGWFWVVIFEIMWFVLALLGWEGKIVVFAAIRIDSLVVQELF